MTSDTSASALTDAEIATLRGTFMLDQERAARSDRLQAAKDDADVAACYYKRLKECGVSPQHALSLTDSWQAFSVAPWLDEE